MCALGHGGYMFKGKFYTLTLPTIFRLNECIEWKIGKKEMHLWISGRFCLGVSTLECVL